MDRNPDSTPSPTHRRLAGRSKAFGCFCLAVLLSACAVTRPPGVTGCENYIQTLDTRFVAGGGGFATGALSAQVPLDRESGFAQSLQNTLQSVRARGQTSLNVLVLSGGGQWGAFGAGFLNGWSAAGPRAIVRRDDIAIVTGISTGALMASFALLGPDWDDALAESYLGTGPEGPDGIRRDPISDDDIFRRQGTLATFFSNAATDPSGRLDARVREEVNGLIDAVANTDAGRQLYVGAVNLEDAGFKIFDLKSLAADAAVAKSQGRPAERTNLEACYTEMLLASAAVPYLFPPRFIDGRAYVDGGARYGAFLGAVNDMMAADAGPAFRERNIFVIVNGDLAVSRIGSVDNNVLDIASRSVSAITDQIYKDSLFRIESEARNGGGSAPWKTHYVYVQDPACNRARRADPEAKGQEFNPTFMKCLYDLGRTLGHRQAWLSFEQVPQRFLRPSAAGSAN